MGTGMVARLLAAGHSLRLFDTQPALLAPHVAAGAYAANSLEDAVAGSAIVMTSLPGPATVKAAAASVAKVKGAQIFVDLSTVGPACATAVSEVLTPAGIAAIDAPVSGGVKGAANGKLAIMASGPTLALQRVQPLLEQLGRVFNVGTKPGLGQTVKLANNLMSAASLAIASEAMAMGAKAGVDPAVMIEILNASSGRNSATQDKIPKHVLNRKFDFGFANALSFKDVRLCLEEAEALGVPMVVGAAVRQMLSITHNLYGPDADCTEMVKVLETWAGVTVGNDSN